MNENTGGYTIKEEFGDVAVFFEGEGNSFSFDVSYKGELVYREGIAGVESTILEKTQGFSVEQKWNYYLEFGRKSADFIEKMTNKQKYTNNEIFGIFHGLAKVVQILKDDYEKNRTTDNSAKAEKKQEPIIPKSLEDLINEGFVVKDKEEYVPTSSIPIFIENCKRLGFISPEKDNEDEINAKFIEKYIKTNCNIETIKRYIRNVKNEKKKKQRNLNLR